jgi:hypothetical protein
MYGEVKLHLHAFLTSVLDERSVSRPGRFTRRGRAPITHLIRGWLGPAADMDEVAKRENPFTSLKSNSARPARRLVAILPEYFIFIPYSTDRGCVKENDIII